MEKHPEPEREKGKGQKPCLDPKEPEQHLAGEVNEQGSLKRNVTTANTLSLSSALCFPAIVNTTRSQRTRKPVDIFIKIIFQGYRSVWTMVVERYRGKSKPSSTPGRNP